MTEDKRFNREPLETGTERPMPQSEAPAPASPDPVDKLFQEHFADTQLGNHTPLYNAATGFREAVKKLVNRD